MKSLTQYLYESEELQESKLSKIASAAAIGAALLFGGNNSEVFAKSSNNKTEQVTNNKSEIYSELYGIPENIQKEIIKHAKSLQKSNKTSIFVITAKGKTVNIARMISTENINKLMNKFNIKSKNSLSELLFEQDEYKLDQSNILIVRFFTVN